ncbi:hypothetical protein GOODEAATRI_012415, partial [Goodea atripinnis]
CFIYAFLWIRREAETSVKETWENAARWLFILPARATYLFRVALDRCPKQQQRPCTQITREERWLDGGELPSMKH